MLVRVCAAAALMLLSGRAAAQPLCTEVTPTHLPPGLAGPCMDAAAGDADGDGDLDLALAMEFDTNVLLLSDGAADPFLCNRASARNDFARSGGIQRLLLRRP